MNLKLANFLTKELQFKLNNIEVIKELSGLNNDCYKIEYLNIPYFIRVSENSTDIKENQILNLCANLDISPKLLYYSSSSRNIALQWIDGRMPTEDEFSSGDFITKLVKNLKTLHNLEVPYSFNPFTEIVNKIELCKSIHLELPYYLDNLLSKLQKIEDYCSKNIDYGLCHNDLNPSNVLISSENLYLIDYEFSAMGDIFFDLATLSWMMSSTGRKNLLETYFTTVTEYHYNKLMDFLFVVKLWNACWSLLKSKDCTDSYDYKKGAEMIFEDLWQNYN